MFAVLFEVTPKTEMWDRYLELAKMLRPEIEQIAGFIDNERYKSLRTEGRVLSLSTWADEKAVIRWRTNAMHHGVQEKGRFEVFQDYHLRVGEIIADTHVPAGQAVRQQRLDATEVGEAKLATISEVDSGGDAHSLQQQLRVPQPGNGGLTDVELFQSIYTEGKLLLLASWRDEGAAKDWQPPASLPSTGRIRHRRVRVIRDYGMSDRREAPQFYPDVTPRRTAA